MSKIANFLNANGAVVAGGAAAAGVAVVALVVSGVLTGPEAPDAPVVEPVVQSTVAPDVAEEPQADAGETTADVAVVVEQPVAEDVAQAPEVAEEVVSAEPAEQISEPDAVEAETQAEVVAPVDPILPKLDTWRFDTQGSELIAVIGGFGAPLTRIAILVDGREVQDVKTDGSGQFAAVLVLDLSEQPRVLSLMQRGEAGDLISQNSVIILPAQPEPVVVAEAAPAAASDVVAQVSQETAAEAVETVETAAVEATVESVAEATTESVAVVAEPEAAVVEQVAKVEDASTQEVAEPTSKATAAPAETVETELPATTETTQTAAVEPQEEAPVAAAEVAPAAAPAAKKAPAILVVDAEGVQVVQPAAASDAAPVSAVAIDAISYADSGEVVVAGRGQLDHFVQIYLNNTNIATAPITADGKWRSELSDVESGVYTLRVDEVDAAGTVTSRVETPFKREAPERVAAAQQVQNSEANDAEGAQSGTTTPAITPTVRVVTVQPGFTLWAIARDSYGEGPMYVRVYEANKDKIRDPDLIYPGQVFTIPE